MRSTDNQSGKENGQVANAAQYAAKSGKLASIKPPPYSNKSKNSEEVAKSSRQGNKSKNIPRNTKLKTKKDISSKSNKKSSEDSLAEQQYAYWTDIQVLDSPGGKQKEEKIDNEKKRIFLESDLKQGYSIQEKKIKNKKEYYLLQKGVETIGWVNKSDLFVEKDVKRVTFTTDYKKWLNDRYIEISKTEGKDKLDKVKGILAQSEKVLADFENGIITDLKGLSISPNYSSPQKIPFVLTEPKVSIYGMDFNDIINPDFGDDNIGITTPHELIEPLRLFADLTETKIKNVDIESNSNLNAGSLYSRNDWHSRLKLPQYRTQSDNLTSPEATCAPTSFTMMAERAGFSRSKVVKAIDEKLLNGLSKDLSIAEKQVMLNKLWSDKGVEFLKATNKGKKKNWEKVRGGRISSRQFKGITKEFRKQAQYEDLVYFYQYLLNNGSRGQINAEVSHNNKLRSGIETSGLSTKNSEFELKQIHLSEKLDSDKRKELKEYLDKGYPMMFSIFHKGDDRISYRHNVTIQSIDAEGIIIDDPYGKENPEYRNNNKYKSTDMFAKGNLSRGNSNFRNKVNYKTKDYTKDKAQHLEENESRGRSTKLTWEMLNESKEEIISYINVWKKAEN